MDKGIFRAKSMERISSPEQLQDYLRITNPPRWILAAAIILLVLSILAWGFFTAAESRESATAVVENGVMSIQFDNRELAKNANQGITVSVGNQSIQLDYVGQNDKGKIVAGAETSLPDGKYEVTVTYKAAKIIAMLFD